MENFELQTPTRIYFGRGRENEAGAIAKAHGARSRSYATAAAA